MQKLKSEPICLCGGRCPECVKQGKPKFGKFERDKEKPKTYLYDGKRLTLDQLPDSVFEEKD